MQYQQKANLAFCFYGFLLGRFVYFYSSLLRPRFWRGLTSIMISNYLTVGCSVKLWYGGGDGNVHSKPSAPSQTRSVAFLPPRAQLTML